MYHIICLLVWMVICWGSNSVAQTDKNTMTYGKIYSLPDLYRIALKLTETIKLSEEDVYIAIKGRQKSVSALIPDLSTYGVYTHYSQSETLGSAVLQPDWQTVWGIKLSQTFTLNGKEFKELELSEKSIRQKEYDLLAVKEAYLFNVASAFYDVLNTIKGLEIAESNVERLEKHKTSVETRLKLEEVTKTDLYRVEAELSQSTTDLMREKNNLELTKAVLARITGIEKPFEIRGPLDKADAFHTYDLFELKSEALSNRTDLISLRIAEEMAVQNVDIVKSAYWPTVTAQGAYAVLDQSPGTDASVDDSLYLELTLNFSIFDGGYKKADFQQALARKRQAKLYREDKEKAVEIEVEQVYLEIVTHQSVLKSQQDQLDYARANFDAVTQQFKYGLANSVDVMDANNLLVKSQKQLSESRYNYQLALLKLDRMKGTFLKSMTAQYGLDR